MKILRILRALWSIFLFLTFFGVFLSLIFAHIDFSLDWRTASRRSANLAPLPKEYSDAVIQVYAARTYGWRGLFAVHSWLVAKEKNAKSYKVYQVIGWRSFAGLPTLSIDEDLPDRMWFGQKPKLIKDIRGIDAEKIMPKINQVAKEYPYKNNYLFWPGPNSNSFIAYLARKIPELKLSLVPTAIGKDFLMGNRFVSKAPSCTGYQLEFYGIFGFLLAKEEGFEINIMGLVFGINPKMRSIILPGIGFLGIDTWHLI